MFGWAWGGGLWSSLPVTRPGLSLLLPSQADRSGPGEPSLQATVLSTLLLHCAYGFPAPRCCWGPPSHRSVLTPAQGRRTGHQDPHFIDVTTEAQAG